MTRIHLDTDVGSDTDDLCALAMLLGWPGVELVGVTTSIDPEGQRVGFVRHALELAGREDVPVARGAAGALSELYVEIHIPDYWPVPIPPSEQPPGAAIDLLAENAEAGATVVSVGPYTNLALLEATRPGLLASREVVLMGGHPTSARSGLPPWGMRDDFNIQQDRVAARIVYERCDPVIVPLAVCLEVTLRSEHLAPLRRGGPLASLLAEQGQRHADDSDWIKDLHEWPGLPDDLLNFQYDPLAAAVAAGWDGAGIERLPVRLAEREGFLEMTVGDGGLPLRVVTTVDGPRFEREWLAAVLAASRAVPAPR